MSNGIGSDQAMQEPRLVKVQYNLNEIRDRCNNMEDRLTHMLDRNRGTNPEVAGNSKPEAPPSQGIMTQVETNVEEINSKLATLQSRLSELESLF